MKHNIVIKIYTGQSIIGKCAGQSIINNLPGSVRVYIGHFANNVSKYF